MNEDNDYSMGRHLLHLFLFKKEAICIFELKQEVATLKDELSKAQNEIAFNNKNNSVLRVCPNIRGYRYEDVTLPTWFYENERDLSKLGQRFTEYCISEALVTKKSND